MTKMILIVFVLGAVMSAAGGARAEVSVSVDASKVVGRIDEKVYGHFLEHIYHSVNGGLWGEMVWDRSFEGGAGGGNWFIEGECVVQKGHADNVRLLFGRRSWKDYELTLEASKIDGREGFLILFREASRDDFYWCNLGGWGNRTHAFERGVKGRGRWGRVGKGRPGRIETGRWYRIRVRCEGPKFQVFLDGEKLLDFTDTEHPHLAGRVGIGTWQTSARFRKLKVTSLDGKVLFEGLPEAVGGPSVSRGWTAYGKGRFRWTNEKPLNSEYCQMIAPTAGEAGVRQEPFCVEKGRAYHGSLWARGRAGGLVVRLLDGKKKLAEAALAEPKADWQEMRFTLRPTASAENAALQVGVAGEGTVWVDQVSLLPAAAQKAGGFRPDLLKAVADLQPPIIRWPGGCFASWYRWKDGVGPQHKRVKYPRSIWDDQDVNSFGTDELVAMCRRVGAEPLIVINIGAQDRPEKRRDYVQEACDWLAYCNAPAKSKWGKVRAANGHPEPYGVKYWEIDNETWGMGPQRYAKAVCEFVPALKKVDPSIRIAACGSGGFNLGWNQEVLRGCARFMDYLSIHHYENPNRFADGPRNYEEFFGKTAELIAASANPKIKIYVSEWNAQSTDWRTGLYAGGLLNAFERCGDVLEMGGPALFLRHASARAWDNAFINFDHRTWFPAPNYVVMKLWREHYGPDRLSISGDLGGLSAVASRSADGTTVYVKAVNPARKPAAVRLEIQGGFKVAKAGLKLVAPGSLQARNTLEKPHAVRAADGKVQRKGSTLRFTLPPLSAGVVRITK